MDGKEIYNTIRRKTKDAFYKNIVKKGYLLKKSELCLLLLFFLKEEKKQIRITEPHSILNWKGVIKIMLLAALPKAKPHD